MTETGFTAFRHPGGTPPLRKYTHSSGDTGAIAAGDAVIVGATAGFVEEANATSPTLLGVAANACAASTNGDVYVYDDPLTEFVGTCTGSSSAALVNTDLDIVGSSGAMLINQAGTTEQVIHVNELYDDAGSKGKLVFVIKRHFKGNVPLTV